MLINVAVLFHYIVSRIQCKTIQAYYCAIYDQWNERDKVNCVAQY